MVYENARVPRYIENIIDCSLLLTKKYEWLLSSSNMDFFTNSVREKLPRSWQETLSTVDPPEFAELLSGNKSLESSTDSLKYQTLWPLSLLALKATAAYLSVPRESPLTMSTQWQDVCVEPEKIQIDNGSSINENKFEYSTHPSHQCKRPRIDCDVAYPDRNTSQAKLFAPKRESVNNTLNKQEAHATPCLTHPRLKQLFHKRVKPKKRHEISKLAKTVATTAARTGCKHIIDIGSGVGHLSRMLAYGYGLKVCCIEGQEALSSQASRLDIEMEEYAAKQISNDEMSKLTRPVHISKSLETNSDPESLLQSVQTAFGTGSENVVFGIVGLHTCGDLGPMLLRNFSNTSEIVFINLVGCCFMKLTTDLPLPARGFPMSEFVSSRAANSHQHLCYEARAVACHANESYRLQLLRGDYSDLKIHCYRATLEEIISVHWPHLRRSNIASVKCTPDMSFASYCKSALVRLGVQVPSSELTSDKTLHNLAAWKQVINVISVRLMLAPVVETIVLLDRLLFVRESGHAGCLVPLFDPHLSPRNHVLVAAKK